MKKSTLENSLLASESTNFDVERYRNETEPLHKKRDGRVFALMDLQSPVIHNDMEPSGSNLLLIFQSTQMGSLILHAVTVDKSGDGLCESQMPPS